MTISTIAVLVRWLFLELLVRGTWLLPRKDYMVTGINPLDSFCKIVSPYAPSLQPPKESNIRLMFHLILVFYSKSSGL